MSFSLKSYTLFFAALHLLVNPANALILYSGDNSANQTAPDVDRTQIFNSVGRITNLTGTSTNGSCVYVRGKYLLTADHVTINNGNFVTFDDITFWPIDSLFTPVQISETDMKLFKLVDDPMLPDTVLFSAPVGDFATEGTFIGWGRGRDPAIADQGAGSTNIWTWMNNDSELAKRWGTNTINAPAPAPFGNYTYTALSSNASNNEGADEASFSLKDSGGGVFVNDNGTWKLVGIATAVILSNSQKTTFSLTGDQTFYVQISSSVSDIEKEIPDLTTFSGWKVDHSLYGADALDSADTDNDGIGQLLEFAFGGDPNDNDISIRPTFELTEDGGSTYLELSVTRPTALQDITYTPKTTTDLNSWPSDSTGIVDDSPTPVDNLDGTETLTYRRNLSVSSVDEAFIRIDVSETS
ncbi:MAG: hypothetical protein ACSHX8_12235 [Opitutaceae bacterium]